MINETLAHWPETSAKRRPALANWYSIFAVPQPILLKCYAVVLEPKNSFTFFCMENFFSSFSLRVQPLSENDQEVMGGNGYFSVPLVNVTPTPTICGRRLPRCGLKIACIIIFSVISKGAVTRGFAKSTTMMGWHEFWSQ